ncbi:MAG: tyrosine--tRNA ligase [Bacilli bacterium]
MKNIIDELNERGLIKDFSNEKELRELFETRQTVYCGFDPSAASMHIGNFIMIMTLMRFQQYGHKVIALAGGATGMIGDPSGKSKERNLQDESTLKFNTDNIKNQLSKFIDLSDPNKGILINNYDWLKDIHILDYLRDFGKYFNINYMLSKDIIASRLDAGISYAEFSYMILQSIDFLHIHETMGCNVQIGGSDQWGNLTAGLELIRKVKGSEEKVGVMTLKLITRSDGKKFGKSEDGALFLNENLTSPYKLYQFFINSNDEDAVHYLKVFTLLPLPEIYEIEKEHLANLGARIAQKKLAFEIVRIVHGEEKALEAVQMSEVFFTNKFDELNEKQITELFANSTHSVEKNTKLEDALISIGVAKSKRESRELINTSSISLNGEKNTNTEEFLTTKLALFEKYIVLKKGKKNYYLLEIK